MPHSTSILVENRFNVEKPLRTTIQTSVLEADQHGWQKEAKPETD
jgi:hypothetical protein